MVKTIFTRLFAAIGMILAVSLIFSSIHDLDLAKTGVDIFKALFFLFFGMAGFYGFLDDFNNKKWLLEK